MGKSLTNKKLDRSNFSSWVYKMNQYLIGQGYWSYIDGALENKPDITNTNYPTWEQGTSRMMYCLATCVHNHIARTN